MVIRRGQIYWLDLGQPQGSGPGYRRPGVVVQDDVFNDSRLNTVIVALLTTNLRLATMSGNVLLAPRRNGVSEPSVVNITQLLAVDKADLYELIGTVTRSEMAQIERGLKLVLSLNNQ